MKNDLHANLFISLLYTVHVGIETTAQSTKTQLALGLHRTKQHRNFGNVQTNFKPVTGLAYYFA